MKVILRENSSKCKYYGILSSIFSEALSEQLLEQGSNILPKFFIIIVRSWKFYVQKKCYFSISMFPLL